MIEEHKIKLLENYISEHKKMTDSVIEILQQENTQLKQQLKDKDEKISKTKQVCINYRLSCNCKDCTFDLSKEISKILESNKED